MKKKILILGLGSIGLLHANVLSKFKNVYKIFVFTKRDSKGFNKIRYLSDIKSINPDYVLICSKTSDHFKHLSFVEKRLMNKTILVEKPLFDKFKNLKIKRNKVIVGYNLRYHPIIRFLKKKIINKKIYSISVFCGSHLPEWRKSRNYQSTYSSNKKEGGGVLLDLSHELDYVQWIFGNIDKIEYAKVKKISNLKITSDDYANIIGKIKNINFSINLNYFTKHNQRTILIDGNNISIEADLIKNTVKIIEKGKNQLIKHSVKKKFTYRTMHKNLLKNNFKIACSFKNGKKLMTLIDRIKKLN